MKVTEFFVGFGPRLWSFQRGETEYGLKAIPAGAYVKIIGMNDFEEVDPADEARTYRAQGTFKRLFTVLAGPFMNLLIAFVLMTALFLVYGREPTTWTVKGVPPGSAAAAAGIAAGRPPAGRRRRAGGRRGTTSGRQLAEQGRRAGDRSSSSATATSSTCRSTSAGGSTPRRRRGLPVAAGADARRRDQSPPTAVPWPLRRPALAAGPVGRAGDAADRRRRAREPPIVRPRAGQPPADAARRRRRRLLRGRAHDRAGEGDAGRRGGRDPAGAARRRGRPPAACFGRLFSPSGVASIAGQVADATQPTTTLAPDTVGRLTPVDGSPEPQAGANEPEDRPISIIGIFQLGSGGGRRRPAELPACWWPA